MTLKSLLNYLSVIFQSFEADTRDEFFSDQVSGTKINNGILSFIQFGVHFIVGKMNTKSIGGCIPEVYRSIVSFKRTFLTAARFNLADLPHLNPISNIKVNKLI